MSVKTTPVSRLMLLFFFCLPLSSFGQFYFEGISYKGQGQALMQSLSSVDISPDGSHVYACSYDQSAVNIFSRNNITGKLTFVDAVTNGADKVEGLGGAYSVLVSPDGRHVYVAGSTDNSVSMFSRDETTGELSMGKTYRNNLNGVSGLEGVYHMDMSPDGNYLYAVSINISALVVFKRNVITGELVFVKKFLNGADGIANMAFPAGVLVSNDGKSVYVSGYGDDAIAIFSRNNSTGALTYEGGVTTTEVPQISGPAVLSMSPDGSQVYISSSINNSLIVMDRNPSTSALSTPVVYTDGQNGVDGLSGVLAIITSSTGDYVYALGSNEDAIAIFSNNSGTLSYIGKVQNNVNSVSNFEYPVYFVISPDDEHVYAASALSQAVVSFDINSIGTHMTYNSNITADPNAIDGLGEAKAVATSPDGKNIYAVGYNDDALVVFDRNDQSGQIDFKEFHKNRTNGVTGLNGATDVIVSNDGKHVYVASQNDHSIVVFSRNTTTGTLTFAHQYRDNTTYNGFTVDGLTGANVMALSTDDKHIYVSGYYENAVAIFSRDPNTDELTYLDVLKDGDLSGGKTIDGLSRTRGICISADGKHVYAAGSIDNAIAIFSRNTTTGLLTYVDRYKDNSNIAGAYDVTVSPDGSFVFVAGPNSDAIVSFNRNSASGLLSYSGKVVNGIDGVGGLDRVKQLIVNPDGDRLYSSSDVEDAISVFNINPSNGLLSFETMAVNNQNKVSGLDGAFGMAVSPDGMFIYGTGDESNAVTIFSCTYLQEQEETICEGSSLIVGNKIYTQTGTYVDTIVNGSCRTVITTDLTVPAKNYDLSAEICSGGIYDFGGTLYNTSGTYEKTFTSQLTGCDSVVTLDLTVVNTYSTTFIDQQICQGDSYTLGANTFTSSGTYEATFTTQHGCDSTVVVNLEVIPTEPTVLNQFICPGELFTYGDQNYIYEGTYTVNSVNPTQCNGTTIINLNVVDGIENITESICQGETYELAGVTYNNTGVYLPTITTENGCVIQLELDLTVHELNDVTVNETICEGDAYIFGGSSYTEAGTYTATFSNANGCDSTVHLNLAVTQTRFEMSETICEGEAVTIGTTEFTTAGTHEVTLQSANGCGDSTVVLHLEVNQSSSTFLNEEICEGESIVVNNQTITQSGTYDFTLTNAVGCDSIVSVEVLVQSAPTKNISAMICSNQAYLFNGEVLSQSGTYTASYSNGNGCDSTVVLALTILDEINANEYIIDDSGYGTGSITIGRVTGGLAPYTYNWSTGSDASKISGLASGTYKLTVTDAKGCSSIFTYEVGNLTSTSTNGLDKLDLEAWILTNPVLKNNVFRLVTTSERTEELDIQLFSISGQVLHAENLQIPIGKRVHEFTAPQAAGLYILHIKDRNGRGKTLKISVQ